MKTNDWFIDKNGNLYLIIDPNFIKLLGWKKNDKLEAIAKNGEIKIFKVEDEKD